MFTTDRATASKAAWLLSPQKEMLDGLPQPLMRGTAQEPNVPFSRR
ncbi:hypothetical protein [Serratia liquefaciens]|nr:hypothetical protein [Serratia liquefaciens]NLU15337.1 hypothetical protein [Serratia liquefaciens]WBL74364.1 hypothetical protein LQ945_08775 [Serratia liquefaciens]